MNEFHHERRSSCLFLFDKLFSMPLGEEVEKSLKSDIKSLRRCSFKVINTGIY